jgi:hypothetical protein
MAAEWRPAASKGGNVGRRRTHCTLAPTPDRWLTTRGNCATMNTSLPRKSSTPASPLIVFTARRPTDSAPPGPAGIPLGPHDPALRMLGSFPQPQACHSEGREFLPRTQSNAAVHRSLDWRPRMPGLHHADADACPQRLDGLCGSVLLQDTDIQRARAQARGREERRRKTYACLRPIRGARRLRGAGNESRQEHPRNAWSKRNTKKRPSIPLGCLCDRACFRVDGRVAGSVKLNANRFP